jgi:transcriptional regulator with XRE-family HTH domain
MVRLARGLTQEDFANESGRTYISELERGIKQPTLQKIDELAAPLGVHPLTPLFLAYLGKYDALAVDKLLRRVRAELQDFLPSGPSE